MRARKLHTEVRREQIAQAALGLIAQGGLRGFNVAALARRVGLVPSAIYRHFAGKDEVLTAVLDLIGARLDANVRAVRAETDDPTAALHGLLVRHVQLIRQNRAIPRLIFAEEFYLGHPERQGRVRRIITGYLAQVADLVRYGQRGGAFRRDADPATVALMFLGLFQPAGVLWFVSGGRFDMAAHAERAWSIFSEAIASHE